MHNKKKENIYVDYFYMCIFKHQYDCFLGMALLRFGEAQKQLGEAEKKFIQSTNIHFLTPLRSFTEGDYRAIQVTHTYSIHTHHHDDCGT